MGDYLRLTEQGLLEFNYDPDTATYISEEVSQDRIFAVLRMSCKIDTGTTLLNIFDTVAHYPALTAFLAQYSWCFAIQQFHNAARLPGGQNTGLMSLEIYRYIETLTYERYNLEADINVSLGFHGIGAPDDYGHTHYSVSLSPMNTLADLPVTLNTACKLQHNGKDVSEWETGYSLLEILDTIYDDISFHGGPQESAVFLQELAGMVDDLKSGRASTVPFDEIFPPDIVN